jgi:hypothetical protein
MKAQYLITIILVFLLFGCSSSVDSNRIVGSWKIVSFKADIPSFNPEIIKLGEKEALSTSYFFRKDHSFQMKSNIFPKGIEGKWEINQEANTIILKDDFFENRESQIQTIIYLDSQNMQWVQTLDSLGTINMTLERIKITD